MLPVPRHEDATRVQCVTCFAKFLSIPTSAFPCARGAPMLHLFVWKLRDAQTHLSPFWHCAHEELGGAWVHVVQVTPREMSRT